VKAKTKRRVEQKCDNGETKTGHGAGQNGTGGRDKNVTEKNDMFFNLLGSGGGKLKASD